jgi:chemotaxis protein MotB
MNRVLNTGITVAVILISFQSCVPSRQFKDLQAKEKACAEENGKLKIQNQDLSTQIAELNSQAAFLRTQVEQLQSDTSDRSRSYQRLDEMYNDLRKSYLGLTENQQKLNAKQAQEIKDLLMQLDSTQEALLKREDEVRNAQRMIDNQKSMMSLFEDSIKMSEENLSRMKRMIAQRDSSVNALKNAVSKALMGFENNGLTIQQKNGMVYVSLEERLLFASGSTVVDKKGEEALKSLSEVIAKNKDINIMVEGHTDNVPISGGPIKDNWDLSVLRATEVVKIITRNKNVEPSRISAFGRGPFAPIDSNNTQEARKKNRRTEIILMPKLNELMKFVSSK